jgi:hypothetical protein
VKSSGTFKQALALTRQRNDGWCYLHGQQQSSSYHQRLAQEKEASPRNPRDPSCEGISLEMQLVPESVIQEKKHSPQRTKPDNTPGRSA